MRQFLLLAALLAAGCRHSPPATVPENPVLVESVGLVGFDVLPVGPKQTLQEALPLRAGEIATADTEQEAGSAAVEALQNHGYPYGQVRIVREPAGEGRARFVIAAEPGTRGFFGEVEIAGNRRVDDRVIRRRIAYRSGDLFSRHAIEATQQRIGSLGLFKSVEIRARDVDAQPAIVPTLVTVEEGNPWRWNLSLGYAAGERLGFGARLSHLNLFGGAERLDLEGRVSAIERLADVGYTQAQSWHPSMTISLQARHREIDERVFFVLSRGGQAAVSWQWTPALATTASYALTHESSDLADGLELLTGLQDGMLSAWSLEVEHNSPADGLLVPARSARALSLHLEQAGGWMPGTFNYFSASGEGRIYRSLPGDRLLLAARVRSGFIRPTNVETDIPFLRRFFLGGSGEMRGWGIYEVSPLSASGEPLGGKSVFFSAVEARFPLVSRLRGAVFAEAGRVWQDAGTLRLNDLLYDVGPGIRIDTPFGLIRFDFGYQLTPIDGLRLDGRPQTSRWRVNFGIGEAF